MTSIVAPPKLLPSLCPLLSEVLERTFFLLIIPIYFFFFQSLASDSTAEISLYCIEGTKLKAFFIFDIVSLHKTYLITHEHMNSYSDF